MKSILILTLIGCALVSLVHLSHIKKRAVTYSLDDADLLFQNFKQQHGKRYRSSSHNDRRKSIFVSNLKIINEHNENNYNNGDATYTLGTTVFADLNPDEFKSFVRKGLKKKPNMDNARMAILPRATAPASIDWRNINGKSYVQAVKNQGSCGSCWSFASVAAIESYAALANGGTVPNLSEQNLVDCTYRSDGCDGGNNDDAWNYLIQKQAGAIATSSNYPYVSGTTQTWNGKCNYTSSMNSGVKVTGYNTLPKMDEATLTNTLGLVGPVTAYVVASSSAFQLYTSGVFTSTCQGSNCTSFMTDHAINLEGYGTDATGNEYYILRNSWGTGWGMSGYMNIARGKNMIGVATDNFYPIVSVSGTTVAPVTTTTKPITTTTKPITTTTKPITTTTKPITTTTKPITTTTKPITTTTATTTTCKNGSGYYLQPNTGCKNYYYCSDSIGTYNMSFVCGAGYIVNQINQNCVSNTSPCVASSGICINGSGWYNYPGCTNAYYCSRTITQYTVPAGTLFNPTTNSFVASTGTTFKCPF